MRRIMRPAIFSFLFAILLGLGAGCGQSPAEAEDTGETVLAISGDAEERVADISMDMIPLTGSPAMFSIPVPTAWGTDTAINKKAEIDYSHAQDGYVMVRYLQKTDKALRVIVEGPSGVSYIYTLQSGGGYEVFPLSDGNGSYQVTVYENVQDNQYATAHTAAISVQLADEFAPFLRPNQYVNYTKDSQATATAAELIRGSEDLLGRIAAIYDYVVGNISYDAQLAATVQSGYLPDVDEVLRKGKGICFDYAALMTAMLRSQGIPAKLVIGYTGDIYHAWINAYSEETGWVNTAIYFDGESWKLMDPTFASSAKESGDIMRYIGDGSNYKAKYLY